MAKIELLNLCSAGSTWVLSSQGSWVIVDRILLSVLSDKILLRVLSDRVLLSLIGSFLVSTGIWSYLGSSVVGLVEFLSKNFNSCPQTGAFPDNVKTWSMLKLFPFTRKAIEKIKITLDLLLFYPTFQKYMKDACKNNLTNISEINYQNISVVSGKVMKLRIVSWLW